LNEISAYLSGRLLSAAEATFRILGLRLHQEYPCVERLDLHLPADNIVVFNPMDDEAVILQQLPAATTKLLQWFVLNESDPAARQWRYVDIPEHYVWQDRHWQPRRRDRMKVARLPAVGPQNLELHAMRLILMVAKGAVSFNDLMTFNGFQYASFREAARAAGLIEDDGEAVTIMAELTRVGISVHSLREQFCTVLMHCAPSNPVELFNMFAVDLMYEEVSEASCRTALVEIDRMMRLTYGKSLRDREYNFDIPIDHADAEVLLPPIANVDSNMLLLNTLRPLLSEEQMTAVNDVVASVKHQRGFNVFGALCSAGTGKTLFANFLACSLRAEGRVVVCVAASALAASLLEGGHTAHHMLHIPIPAHDGSYCSFSVAERIIIASADLLIWDEASMIHQEIADTVSRSLQDVRGNFDQPFGGLTVCFMGDFKQLLPVVRGGKGDNYTLQRCLWWRHVRRLSFSFNWRASQDAAFADLLEAVGSGRLADVEVPAASRVCSLQNLVQQVLGSDLAAADTGAMILSLTLDDADVVNSYCINQMPGLMSAMHAADTYVDCRQPDLYPQEVVAGMRIAGVPPSNLQLKVGARYMIIRNISKQVFNGVRCVLVAVAGTRCVFVRLISGPGAGTTILLPSMVFSISPEQSGLPFTIRRRQLPLIPAFAVTVHKAQGQTLAKVGLFLTTSIFTHGQLYTALSRTRGWGNIRVFNTLSNPHIIHNCVSAHVLGG